MMFYINMMIEKKWLNYCKICIKWKNEKTKNPYLFKIEESELSSINEYLYDKPMKMKEGNSGGGGFAARMAALQKRMEGGSN